MSPKPKQQSLAVQVGRDQMATLKSYLEARNEDIATVLGGHREAKRLVASAMICAAQSPQLRQCTPVSIARCVMQAAVLGLDLSSGLGEAHLVPFKNACTLIVGYRGWQRKASEIGYNVVSEPVFEGEAFNYTKVPLVLTHTPVLRESDRGELVGVYAAAFRGSELYRAEWVTSEDIAKAQKMSKSPAWQTWPNRMRRKLAISRLCRELSPQRGSGLEKLVQIDEASEAGGRPDPVIDRTVDIEIKPDNTLDAGSHSFHEAPKTYDDDLPPWGFDDSEVYDAETGEVKK